MHNESLFKSAICASGTIICSAKFAVRGISEATSSLIILSANADRQNLFLSGYYERISCLGVTLTKKCAEIKVWLKIRVYISP